MEIVVHESPKMAFERRLVALEAIAQLCRIPGTFHSFNVKKKSLKKLKLCCSTGLVTELYLNYDCDCHASDLFELLIKQLSKNVNPASGIFATHLLSLETLLVVVDSIDYPVGLRPPWNKVPRRFQRMPVVCLRRRIGRSQTATVWSVPMTTKAPPANNLLVDWSFAVWMSGSPRSPITNSSAEFNSRKLHLLRTRSCRIISAQKNLVVPIDVLSSCDVIYLSENSINLVILFSQTSSTFNNLLKIPVSWVSFKMVSLLGQFKN